MYETVYIEGTKNRAAIDSNSYNMKLFIYIKNSCKINMIKPNVTQTVFYLSSTHTNLACNLHYKVSWLINNNGGCTELLCSTSLNGEKRKEM